MKHFSKLMGSYRILIMSKNQVYTSLYNFNPSIISSTCLLQGFGANAASEGPSIMEGSRHTDEKVLTLEVVHRESVWA